MTSGRGTSNTNSRGSSKDRAARRRWLLDTFGDGTTVQCSTCPEMLTEATVTVDRHPIPGCEGGRYVRGNIRPMCNPCNMSHGGRLGRQRQLGES